MVVEHCDGSQRPQRPIAKSAERRPGKDARGAPDQGLRQLSELVITTSPWRTAPTAATNFESDAAWKSVSGVTTSP